MLLKPQILRKAGGRVERGFISKLLVFGLLTAPVAARAQTTPSPPPSPPPPVAAAAAAPAANAAADSQAKRAAEIPVDGVTVPPPVPPGFDKASSLNAADPNVAPPPTSSVLSNMMEPFDYDARGRRDPFSELIGDKPLDQGTSHGPLLPLQGFQLSELRLTGILWNVRQPKAIFKDPKGGIYVVGPNAKIGPHNGYVASIREGEIVVVETVEQDGRLVSTAQVVKIAK